MTQTSERFETGKAVRREILGEAYVSGNPETTWAFSIPFTQVMTEFAWGTIWARPGLARRDRSLVTIGILAGLGRLDELTVHLGVAVKNGLKLSEIQEAILQVSLYGGAPAGVDALKCARKAFDQLGIDVEAELA